MEREYAIRSHALRAPLTGSGGFCGEEHLVSRKKKDISLFSILPSPCQLCIRMQRRSSFILWGRSSFPTIPLSPSPRSVLNRSSARIFTPAYNTSHIGSQSDASFRVATFATMNISGLLMEETTTKLGLSSSIKKVYCEV